MTFLELAVNRSHPIPNMSPEYLCYEDKLRLRQELNIKNVRFLRLYDENNRFRETTDQHKIFVPQSEYDIVQSMNTGLEEVIKDLNDKIKNQQTEINKLKQLVNFYEDKELI